MLLIKNSKNKHMKRIILLVIVSLSFGTLAYSQSISDNAIGLRLGDNEGFGAEISYQRAFSDNNRGEFDLGWRSGNNFSGFKLTGLYQWVWDLGNNFNWYAGAGGGLGSYSYNGHHNHGNHHGGDFSETFIFIAGDIGIEYDFDFPLLLSLDFRPELGFGDYRDDLDFDIALGVRYQF